MSCESDVIDNQGSPITITPIVNSVLTNHTNTALSSNHSSVTTSSIAQTKLGVKSKKKGLGGATRLAP